jgi:uncharacterized protein
MSDIAAKAEAPPPSLARRITAFPLSLMLIAILVFALGVTIGTFLIKRLHVQHDSPIQLVDAAILILSLLLVFWPFFRFVERTPTGLFARNGWRKELAAGFLGGAALFSVMVAAVWALGGYQVTGHSGFATLWAPLVGAALIPGFTEELFFRGILFRYVERAAGSWIALALTSILFGAAHLFNQHATWFSSFAIAIEAGILLGAVYMLTRRLWAVMGLHAAWNLTQGWVFGLPVSGGTGGVGLLNGRLTGPEFLTGGAFGLEASVPAVVVATTAGIAILVVAIRRGQVVPPMWISARAGAIPAGQSHTSPS